MVIIIVSHVTRLEKNIYLLLFLLLFLLLIFTVRWAGILHSRGGHWSKYFVHVWPLWTTLNSPNKLMWCSPFSSSCFSSFFSSCPSFSSSSSSSSSCLFHCQMSWNPTFKRFLNILFEIYHTGCPNKCKWDPPFFSSSFSSSFSFFLSLSLNRHLNPETNKLGWWWWAYTDKTSLTSQPMYVLWET